MIGLPLLRMREAEAVVEVVQAALLGGRAGGVADVAAHAEGALAGAGEHDHPDRLVVGGRLERLGSSEIVWQRKAFRRSGRLIVIVARPASTS